MARYTWMVVALFAGCAPARFELRAVRSSAPAEAHALTDELARHHDRLAACFDALGRRAGILGPLDVKLSLVVEPDAVHLFDLRPIGRGTVIDGPLDACVESVVAGLGGGPEAALEIALRVTPRAEAAPPVPTVAAGGFRPAE